MYFRKKRSLALRASEKESIVSVGKLLEQLLASEKAPKPNPMFDFISLWPSTVGFQYISLGGCSTTANVLIQGLTYHDQNTFQSYFI